MIDEVDFDPGVGHVGGDEVGAVGFMLGTAAVAAGDARGDIERAQHEHHAAGIELAVAALRFP